MSYIVTIQDTFFSDGKGKWFVKLVEAPVSSATACHLRKSTAMATSSHATVTAPISEVWTRATGHGLGWRWLVLDVFSVLVEVGVEAAHSKGANGTSIGLVVPVTVGELDSGQDWERKRIETLNK